VSGPSPYDSKYSWQREYFAAILETDNETLRQRIQDAEQVITGRLDALKNDGHNPGEMQALQDALNALMILKSERG